jgi:hypothetical protein
VQHLIFLGVCPVPNADLMPTQLAYVGFHLRFIHLLKITGGYLLTVLLFLAVVLSFISGSIWLVLLTVAALAIKIYPVVLLLIAFLVTAFLTYKYWRH